MGLKFFQTRSNARVLHDTLPPICIERVVSRKSEQGLYTKNVSRRFAPTITFKGKWKKIGIRMWQQAATASNQANQTNGQKRGNPWYKTVAPWTSESRNCYTRKQKKPNKDEFVISSTRSRAILTKMIYNLIWNRIPSQSIQRKFDENDPRTWKRVILWILRNGF